MTLSNYIKTLSLSAMIFTFVNSCCAYFINFFLTGSKIPVDINIQLRNISMHIIQSLAIALLIIIFNRKAYKSIYISDFNKNYIICFTTFIMAILFKNISSISLLIAHSIKIYNNIQINYNYFFKIIIVIFISNILSNLYIKRYKNNNSSLLDDNVILFYLTFSVSLSYMISKIPFGINLYLFYLHNPISILSDYSLLSALIGVLFVFFSIKLLFRIIFPLKNTVIVQKNSISFKSVVFITSTSLIFPYLYLYLSDISYSVIKTVTSQPTCCTKFYTLTPFRMKNILIFLISALISFIISKQTIDKTN